MSHECCRRIYAVTGIIDIMEGKRRCIETVSKKAQFSFLGKLLIFIVVALVLILFGSQLFSIMTGSSGKSACMASAIANSAANTATFGSDVIKLDCPTKFVRVQIESPPLVAPKDTKVISVSKSYGSGELATMRKVQYFDNDKYYSDEKLQHMYRVNEVVAKEMKECWDNMGNGKLNLFSAWFQYWGTEKANEWKSRGGNKDQFTEWVKENIPHKLPAPTVCVICSRIEIDKKLYSEMSDLMTTPSNSDYKNKPNSLIYWLTHTPIPRTSVSYYEYLLDDVNKDIYGPSERNYQYTEKPFAIVFARSNVNVMDQVAKQFNFGDAIIGIVTVAGPGPIGKIAQNILAVDVTAKTVKGMIDASTGVGATSALYIVPYDDASLKEYCSTLAN